MRNRLADLVKPEKEEEFGRRLRALLAEVLRGRHAAEGPPPAALLAGI
jgi:hypothetical protein